MQLNVYWYFDLVQKCKIEATKRQIYFAVNSTFYGNFKTIIQKSYKYRNEKSLNS